MLVLPKLDIRKWTLSCQLLEKKFYGSLWLQVANWWGKTLCSIMPLLPWRYFVLFQIFIFLICLKREMQANLSNKCMKHPSRKFNVFLSRHAPQPISKPWGNFTYLVMIWLTTVESVLLTGQIIVIWHFMNFCCYDDRE